MISLNIEKTFGFISKEKVFAYEAEVKAAQEMLEKGTGKGNDFLGWLHLPSSITKEHLADLNATAKVLRDNCEVVIVAGIGGSYLGARAVIEALSNSFTWLQEKKTAPVMIYAGHNISEDYLYELTEFLKDKNGNLTGLITVKLEAKKDEKTGRMNMVPVEGSEQKLDADLVLIAAGFLGTEKYVADAFGVKLNARTNVETEEGRYKTNVKKVFTAGDMHRGQSLVVWAIREGREAAREVDESLMGYSYLSVQ